ncbi:MAG: SGNH/GDSL hydrolase family protein [Bacteroidetes bacterium]|nr:SGNH/GDSL hydrolase family protein [Bacteroidota bacterium]
MYSFLALGDSYTIGELVPLQQSFPYQTAQLLRTQKIEVSDPVIIAKTGWTTDELNAAICEEGIKETFSFVSLLIGVNNQYRGRSVDDYEREFEQLLHKAKSFANGNPNHVFVLSIPDWGVTPFAQDRDAATIAHEINLYNHCNHQLSQKNAVHYLNITESTRANGTKPTYLAEDKLHPSALEYEIWAKKLAPLIAFALKNAP